MQKFKIKADPYRFSINVIISDNVKKVIDYVNRKQHRTGLRRYRRVHFKNNYGVFCSCKKYTPVIWLPKKPTTAREMSTVAHEILHSVFEVMRWNGITLSESSEEAFTYLHTHLMQQFLKKIKQ